MTKKLELNLNKKLANKAVHRLFEIVYEIANDTEMSFTQKTDLFSRSMIDVVIKTMTEEGLTDADTFKVVNKAIDNTLTAVVTFVFGTADTMELLERMHTNGTDVFEELANERNEMLEGIFETIQAQATLPVEFKDVSKLKDVSFSSPSQGQIVYTALDEVFKKTKEEDTEKYEKITAKFTEDINTILADGYNITIGKEKLDIWTNGKADEIYKNIRVALHNKLYAQADEFRKELEEDGVKPSEVEAAVAVITTLDLAVTIGMREQIPHDFYAKTIEECRKKAPVKFRIPKEVAEAAEAIIVQIRDLDKEEFSMTKLEHLIGLVERLETALREKLNINMLGC